MKMKMKRGRGKICQTVIEKIRGSAIDGVVTITDAYLPCTVMFGVLLDIQPCQCPQNYRNVRLFFFQLTSPLAS